MGTQKDSPEQMLSAHAWLEQVAEELGLPQDVVRASVKDVLDLTSAVAHHRSRPAAPVTAFLIGLAAGRAADQDEELYAEAHPRVERITTLALDGISEQP